MPWTGAIYIRDNGQFTGSLVWTDDLNANIKILASRHDTHDQDIADGITACLNKNGANSPTANISWGNFKITNLSAGSAATDSARTGQTTTALSIDPSSKILTATRADGDLTVDLTPIVVAGDTSDFARLSLPQTFTAANIFTGGGGEVIGLPGRFNVTSLGAASSWTYFHNDAVMIIQPSVAPGSASFSYQVDGSVPAGARMFMGSAEVWNSANLDPSGFISASANVQVTGNWAFTANSLQLPANLTLSSGVGNSWAVNIAPQFLTFTPSAGGAALVYQVDAATYTAGAALLIGGGTEVWNKANFRVINSAAPTGGKPNDCAIVQTGANKGLWSNIAGTWTKIV